MGSCTLSSGGVCVVVVLLCLAACCLTCARGAVPAIYVLGDSQADVGNNNYLLHSLLKANFPHNGIDYPGGKPTGRFSNGYNFVDLIGTLLSCRGNPKGKALVQRLDQKIQLSRNYLMTESSSL
uniref:Uncharacterized protein n=1 Tax=Oryza sativa subsp. japonica TaxID=39947 RepID=Q84NW9_ORYSJ|nr:unknown protein [Oryza sativa Japonica Group]